MSDERSLYDRLGQHEGILKLIKPFYADVRQHAVIGPIFDSHVQDWPAHLEKITGFWAMQAGGNSNYPGGFTGGAYALAFTVRDYHFVF